MTAPVELAARVGATTEAPEAKLIPPVPAFIVTVGAVREFAVMPPVPPVPEPALRVMEVPAVRAELNETLPAVAVSVIVVPAVSAGLTVRLPAEDVSAIVLAVREAPDTLRIPEEDSVIVPILLDPVGVKLPVRFKLPLGTLRANEDPLPAEEFPSVTTAAVSLPMLTLPLEFSDRVPALSVLAPA